MLLATLFAFTWQSPDHAPAHVTGVPGQVAVLELSAGQDPWGTVFYAGPEGARVAVRAVSRLTDHACIQTKAITHGAWQPLTLNAAGAARVPAVGEAPRLSIADAAGRVALPAACAADLEACGLVLDAWEVQVGVWLEDDAEPWVLDLRGAIEGC